MSKTSVLSDAIALVRHELYGYLDEADFLAMKYVSWSEEDIQAARALIPDLVTVIRSLVAEHGEPANPEAPACGICGTAWPCLALTTIHRLIKDPDGEFVKLIRARPL